MKIAIATVAALLAVSSMAFAADKGGKSDKNQDTTNSSGTMKGNGLNVDGSSDDAMKCRAHTAGAALCGEKMDRQ